MQKKVMVPNRVWNISDQLLPSHLQCTRACWRGMSGLWSKGKISALGSLFLSSSGTALLMKCRVLALSKGRRELKANNVEKVKSPASERSKNPLEMRSQMIRPDEVRLWISQVWELQSILARLDSKIVNLGMQCQESSRLLNYWPGLKPLVFSQYSRYDKFIFTGGLPQK